MEIIWPNHACQRARIPGFGGVRVERSTPHGTSVLDSWTVGMIFCGRDLSQSHDCDTAMEMRYWSSIVNR